MSVYTKGGDGGMTDLFGMQRVSKDNIKVKAYGAVDELNAVIGQARASLMNLEDKDQLKWVQNRLIHLCSELAGTEEVKESIKDRISSKDTKQLEHWIDEMDKMLPKFSSWIIPGDDAGSAAVHVARTVARRSEREITTLNRQEKLTDDILKFINRISDYLFQLGRKINMDIEVSRIKEAVEQKVIISRELEHAKAIADASEKRAHDMGVPVTIAITDSGGHLMLLRRMDGCLLGSLDIAQSKAKTSVMLRMRTEQVGELSQPGMPLYGIEQSNGGLTPFGGGLPIYKNDRLIGGIGISGGSVEEDIIIATAGLEVMS